MRRSLLVATLALPVIAAAGWALQAVSLVRPSAAQLQLVRTLRALDDFHGSQASVDLGGRRYRASCTQRWDSAGRAFRVIVDPGVLTETGTHLAATNPLEEGEFELAGCPRSLLDWLSSELVHGASVRFRSTSAPGGVLDRLELHPRTLPLEVDVAPATGLPVRITLTASHLQGTSIVHFGTAR